MAGDIAAMAIRAPSAANRRAMAAPMPLAPPVMIVTLPSSRIAILPSDRVC